MRPTGLIRIFKPKLKFENPDAGRSLTVVERRALLLPAIRADLRVARLSLFIDSIASLLTCFASSTSAFTVFSAMSALGGGALPANQSIMLALMSDGRVTTENETGIGEVFGAISILQAIGQNIIGVRHIASPYVVH